MRTVTFELVQRWLKGICHDDRVNLTEDTKFSTLSWDDNSKYSKSDFGLLLFNFEVKFDIDGNYDYDQFMDGWENMTIRDCIKKIQDIIDRQ